MSLRNVAERFGLATTSLHRHRHRHIPAALAASTRADEAIRADALFDRLEELTDKASDLGTKAEQAGDLRTSLAAVRERVRIVELIAKVSGQMAPVKQQVQLAVMPQWRLVMESLSKFPNAKVAVARALERGVSDERHPTTGKDDEGHDVYD